MKIVFFEANEGDQATLASLIKTNQLLAGAEVTFIKEKLSGENLTQAREAEVLGVFINSLIKQEQIDQLPHLKMIVTMSTGFDHIDTAYAQSKNIVVANVPAYGSRTVAEFTFALMLGLSRKAFAAYRQVKDQQDFSISNYEGFNLQGKTLGIIGTGRIGQNVAEIAKGFGMKMLAYDTFPNVEASARLGFVYTCLEVLLSQSDVVTLHVPYNPQTHHLLNSENIFKIKPGALLINTSRGEVVETESLITALDQNLLAGVGIDVLEGERQLIDEWHLVASGSETQAQLKTLVIDHALINHPKVAYTPHIAFFTKEAKHEILSTTVDDIASFAAGAPKNTVK